MQGNHFEFITSIDLCYVLVQLISDIRCMLYELLDIPITTDCESHSNFFSSTLSLSHSQLTLFRFSIVWLHRTQHHFAFVLRMRVRIY